MNPHECRRWQRENLDLEQAASRIFSTAVRLLQKRPFWRISWFTLPSLLAASGAAAVFLLLFSRGGWGEEPPLLYSVTELAGSNIRSGDGAPPTGVAAVPQLKSLRLEA